MLMIKMLGNILFDGVMGTIPLLGDLIDFRIRANARNYMAQPMLNLSTAPTLIGNQAEPRHLDLRPFILSGAAQYVTTGGLTRVAMRKGSIVVNSSQGGGSKDTWIVE